MTWVGEKVTKLGEKVTNKKLSTDLSTGKHITYSNQQECLILLNTMLNNILCDT